MPWKPIILTSAISALVKCSVAYLSVNGPLPLKVQCKQGERRTITAVQTGAAALHVIPELFHTGTALCTFTFTWARIRAFEGSLIRYFCRGRVTNLKGLQFWNSSSEKREFTTSAPTLAPHAD